MDRLFALFLVVWGLLGSQEWLHAEDLVVKDGRIEIPQGSPKLYELRGAWNFYEQARLSPELASCPSADRSAVEILDFWRKDVLDEHPSWKGAASSFCLDISNPEKRELALWWPDRGSIDAYANGVLVLGQGLLLTKPQSYSFRQTELIELPGTDHITLIIHGQNEFGNWRKSKPVLWMGAKQEVLSRYAALRNRDMFIVSALLVTAFFQFTLFGLQRQRTEALMLGLFALFITMRSLAICPTDLDRILFQERLGFQIYSLGFIGYFMAAATFYQFLCYSFPRYTSKFVQKLLWVLSLSFSLVCVVFQNKVYGEILIIFHIAAALGMGSALITCIQAIRAKEKGSLSLGLGTMVLVMTAAHDMALSQGMGLSLELFPYGQIVFVLSAAILNSIRYAHVFEVVSHLSHELTKMVPVHVIERIRAGQKLEACMPVGESEAVVLVFDIVGSSKLQSPNFRAALETCMGLLHERIHKGYDTQTLKACGYRLKDMGDGLICTVGFPYGAIAGESLEQQSVTLALDLVTIFHKAMASYSPQTPIFCGIGMVKGTVEGFFPSSGPKLYDLRGYSIVLATRYETMRNLVYKKVGKTGSVLFIHDNVYQSLARETQQKFVLWDVTKPDQMIRDDSSAKQAWYQIIAPELSRS